MEFYDKKVLIVFCFLSTMRDIKCQIQFTGIRHYTINIKSTKIDVSVSETQNPVDFCGRFEPLSENIQSLLLTLENV